MHFKKSLLVFILILGCQSTKQNNFPVIENVSLYKNNPKISKVEKTITTNSDSEDILQNKTKVENTKSDDVNNIDEQNNILVENNISTYSAIAKEEVQEDAKEKEAQGISENIAEQEVSFSDTEIEYHNEQVTQEDNLTDTNTKVNMTETHRAYSESNIDKKDIGLAPEENFTSNEVENTALTEQDTEITKDFVESIHATNDEILFKEVAIPEDIEKVTIVKEDIVSPTIKKVEPISEDDLIQNKLKNLQGTYLYDVYVEDEKSGWQKMVVSVVDDSVRVDSTIKFSFTALWFFTVSYEHSCIEIWKKGQLESLTTNTMKNGTAIALSLQKQNNSLIGSLDKKSLTAKSPVSTNNAWNLGISFLHKKTYDVINPEDGLVANLNLIKQEDRFVRLQGKKIPCTYVKAEGKEWQFWFHPDGFLMKQQDLLKGYKVEIIINQHTK